MLNVPESVKELFLRDGTHKNFRVHFPNGEHADLTNEHIESESVRFSESICSRDELEFGLCEQSSLEFTCFGLEESIKGKIIEAQIEIDVSELIGKEEISGITYPEDLGYPVYAIKYGRFKVDDCKREAGPLCRRDVSAYSEGEWKFPKELIDQMKNYARHDQKPFVLSVESLIRRMFPRSFVDEISIPDTGIYDRMDDIEEFVDGTTVYTIERHSKVIPLKPFGIAAVMFRWSIPTDIYKADEIINATLKSYGIEQTIRKPRMRVVLDIYKDYFKIVNGKYSEIPMNGTEHFEYVFDGQQGVDSVFVVQDVEEYVESKKVTSGYSHIGYYGDYKSDVGYLSCPYKLVLKSNDDILYSVENSDDTIIAYGMDSIVHDIQGFWDIYKRRENPHPLAIVPDLEKKVAYYTSTNARKERVDYVVSEDSLNGFDVGEIISSYCRGEGAFGKFERSGEFKLVELDNMRFYRHPELDPSQLLLPSEKLVPREAIEGRGIYPRNDLYPDWDLILRKDASEEILPRHYSSFWYDDALKDLSNVVQSDYLDEDGNVQQFKVDETNADDEKKVYDLSGDYLIRNSYSNYYKERVTDDGDERPGSYYRFVLVSPAVENLYRANQNAKYCPYELESIGMPWIEPGDSIRIVDVSGAVIQSPVLSRTISGIQHLTDSIEAR